MSFEEDNGFPKLVPYRPMNESPEEDGVPEFIDGCFDDEFDDQLDHFNWLIVDSDYADMDYDAPHQISHVTLNGHPIFEDEFDEPNPA